MQSPSKKARSGSTNQSLFGLSAELVCGLTDTGNVRTHNEDCYLIREEKNLCIVADGMGGYEAGEIASYTAVEQIDQYISLDLTTKLGRGDANIESELKLSVETANRTIIRMAEQSPSYRGMGCTVVVALILGEELHLCHVGDSRVYVCNPAGINLLTTDHSAVMNLVKTGRMTLEEARRSPAKNRLSQAVGAQGPIDPEYSYYPLKERDKVLLCSDGLWDMLSDQEIFHLLNQNKPVSWICENLVKTANDAGGLDNITVVVFQYRTN